MALKPLVPGAVWSSVDIRPSKTNPKGPKWLKHQLRRCKLGFFMKTVGCFLDVFGPIPDRAAVWSSLLDLELLFKVLKGQKRVWVYQQNQELLIKYRPLKDFPRGLLRIGPPPKQASITGMPPRQALSRFFEDEVSAFTPI